MKKTILGNNCFLFEFVSVSDFVEYSSNGPKFGYSRDASRSSCKFSGGTWQQAVEQSITGNPELVKEIVYGVECISGVIDREAPEWIRDVEGDYFDVADYLAGEPEVFRKQEDSGSKKIIPVYASFAMGSSISNSVIKNRGCAIIALVDELQKSGNIVELNLVFGSLYNGKTRYIKINIAQDPADLDAAAFVLANPLCLRRIYLAFLETEEKKESCGKYGHPVDFAIELIYGDCEVPGINFVGSCSFDFFSFNYSSMKAAKEHVKDMISEFITNPKRIVRG